MLEYHQIYSRDRTESFGQREARMDYDDAVYANTYIKPAARRRIQELNEKKQHHLDVMQLLGIKDARGEDVEHEISLHRKQLRAIEAEIAEETKKLY